MTSNDPGRKPATSDDGSGVDDTQVLKYLRAHPDFLVRHPELLEVLEVPSRFSHEKGVVDLQAEALKRLKARKDDLIDTSRTNMSVQMATHEAVLALLDAEDLDGLVQVVQDEVPLLLDLDLAAMALESGGLNAVDYGDHGVPVLLPEGEVARRLGKEEVILLDNLQPGDTLFGASRDMIRSAALARLFGSDTMPEGLLVLGSREPDAFQTGQGVELITFLARVTEVSLERWLDTSIA